MFSVLYYTLAECGASGNNVFSISEMEKLIRDAHKGPIVSSGLPIAEYGVQTVRLYTQLDFKAWLLPCIASDFDLKITTAQAFRLAMVICTHNCLTRFYIKCMRKCFAFCRAPRELKQLIAGIRLK